jgi:membrane protease YdiL (CAAX protease family)
MLLPRRSPRGHDGVRPVAMVVPEIRRPPPEAGPDRTPSGVQRWTLGATLVAGTVLLAVAFSQPGDSGGFYLFAFAAAGVWLAGGLAADNVRLGRVDRGRAVIAAIAAGAGAFGVLVVGTEVAQRLPGLSGAVDQILATADAGSTGLVLALTVVSAIGEEVYFRGAVMSALPARWAVAGGVTVYVVVTAFTANLALVTAAAVMGTLFAIERRATQGVAAPTITHAVWAVLMVVALPR